MWRSTEISKIGSFVPGGARGVLLKLKAPLSCASAESRVFILDGRIRFKVRWIGREGDPKVAAEKQGHSW